MSACAQFPSQMRHSINTHNQEPAPDIIHSVYPSVFEIVLGHKLTT